MSEEILHHPLSNINDQVNSLLLKLATHREQDTVSFPTLRLKIIDAQFLQDANNSSYLLSTAHQQFFQEHIGETILIEDPTVKPELAPNSHNMILTLFAYKIRLDTATSDDTKESEINARFQIFSEIATQTEDAQIINAACLIKKHLVQSQIKSAVIEQGADVWKSLTTEYIQALNAQGKKSIKKKEKQNSSTTKEALKPQTPVNKKRKQVKTVQDDADGYNSATKKLKSQLEEQEQEETILEDENNMETEVNMEKNDQQNEDESIYQGAVSVAKQPRNNNLANKNLSVKKITIADDRDGGEALGDEEMIDENAQNSKASQKLSVKQPNDKKKNTNNLFEKNKEIAIQLKQQQFIDTEEYARKVSKLQKFVLKKELLFFIAQNDFQKKPEVPNMVLPRDAINKDLLKAYTLNTVRHLEAQYK